MVADGGLEGHVPCFMNSDIEEHGNVPASQQCRLAPLTVREATSEDVGAMVELLAELFTIERDFDPDSSKQEAGLRMLLDSPKDCVLVADSGGQV
jgi:hypothetical protein